MGRVWGEGTWARRALVLVVGLSAFVSTVGVVAPAGASPPSATGAASTEQAPEDPEPLEVDRPQERFADAVEQAEGAGAGAVELPPGALDGQLSGTLAEQIAAATAPPPTAEATAGPADDTGLSVVEDLDGDGEVSPPLPAEPEPQVEEPAAPAEPELPAPAELGELAELAEEVDVDVAELEPGDEIPELRTEESRTFLEEDGELRTEISTMPLHTEDA